jgi:hypothetical protein
LVRWWHRGIRCCLAAVGREGVGGVGGGVGDESAAASVLAVGLEGGNWGSGCISTSRYMT